MATLFVILSFAGLIAGVMLLGLGWRGQRTGEERRCPRCEFDVTSLFARSASVTCPECSLHIEYPSDARVGTRHHRNSLLVTGLALLLCCAPVALIATLQNSSSGWLQRRKPVGLLLWEWQKTTPRWQENAIVELRRRQTKGTLSPADLQQLGAALWQRVSAGLTLQDPHETALFSDAVESGTVPREAFIKRQLAAYDWRLETPAALRAGTSLPITIVDGGLHEAHRLRQWAFSGVLLKSQVQIMVTDEAGSVVHQSRLLPSDFEMYAGFPMRRAITPLAINLEPGMYRLSATMHVRYYAPWQRMEFALLTSPDLSDPALLEPGPSVKTITIDQPLHVIDDAQSLVALDTDPSRQAAMRDVMSRMHASLSTLTPGHAPMIVLWVDPQSLPKGTCGVYAVRIEQGAQVATTPSPGTERPPSWSVWRISPLGFGGRSSITIPNAAGFKPGLVRITLTPSLQMAERLSGPDAVESILSQAIVVETHLQPSKR